MSAVHTPGARSTLGSGSSWGPEDAGRLDENDLGTVWEKKNNLKKKSTHEARSHLEVIEIKGHTGLPLSSLLGFSVSLLDLSSPTPQSSLLIGVDWPVRAEVLTCWGGGHTGALSQGT